jgi:5-amino-6-(5-phosphoribosylamino)uracil reductase
MMMKTGDPLYYLDGRSRMANRPRTVAILAQSLDGKIALAADQRASFSSPEDQLHLQQRVAECDAVVMGANTLRAYGTSVRIHDPDLLMQRQERQQAPQPITVICSWRGDIDPAMPFFRQPLTRWLWTTAAGAKAWQQIQGDGFEEMWIAEDWALPARLAHLADRGIRRLGVLGGGEVIGAFLQAGLLDELWVTVCPVVFSDRLTAPTGLSNWQLPQKTHLNVRLLDCQPGSQEVFLHYAILPHPQ